MTPQSIKKREVRKQANRLRLIEAAIESIAAHGLTDTTVSTVVERAGLSRGLVNLQFETKDALLAEALRFLTNEWRATWRKTVGCAQMTPAEKLQTVVMSVFEPPVFSRKKLATWHAFYADSRYRATYRKVCGETDRAHLDALSGLCRRLIEDGRHDDLDAVLVAKGLQSMTDGLCVDCLINPRTTTRARIAGGLNVETLDEVHDGAGG
jgi:TetR/AcrR family transcriptional repressor of bet genes